MLKEIEILQKKRFRELMELAKLNLTQLSDVLGYKVKNLSNYANGDTANPNAQLITGIMKKYPRWNLRYWLLGEGDPMVSDDKIVIIQEPDLSYRNVIVEELTEQLAYLRKELDQKNKIIEALKAK